MEKTILYLFVLSVSLEIIYLLLFILTIRLPGFRFWPPPGPRSWQFFTAWLMACFVAANFLILSLLDFDSFILPGLRVRLPIALVFLIFGGWLGSWSFLKFGLRTTIGLVQKLITSGPYRFTRNPQYIGDSANILGFMILTNSWMAWVMGILGITLNTLAPFTEEPWLEEKFGEAYRNYKKEVPRFFNWRKES